MWKYLTFMAVISPTFLYGQATLAARYVDDRINQDTYLHFKPDSTFEFSYAFDTMNDKATGHYRLDNDTLFLTFTTDTAVNSRQFDHASGVRADTLIIKGHRLYKIENGKSREFIQQDLAYHRPPKNWHYKRKYWLFGPWVSTWSRYYMVDERFATWKKWRKRAGIK